VRVQPILAGLALIAVALLAAIPLAHVRTDAQPSGQAEVAQRDPSPAFVTP
jgi:hypothetical protein